MPNTRLRLLCGLAMVASAVLPVGADEPIYRSIKMPAGEQYREPYDSLQSGQEEKSEFQWHVKITVSPATFPSPLLKYRLNVYSTELESGNAAPLYSQAWAEYQKVYAEAEKQWYASNEYFNLRKNGASEQTILGELFRAVPLKPAWSNSSYPKSVSPAEEATFYGSMEPVYRLLEEASRKRDADWRSSVEKKGGAFPLNNLNDLRALARYLCGKADWEIRNGRYEDAAKTLRIGIAMGNHVEAGTPLVGILVGLAIQSIMQREMMTLASQPDAPNLYPALTQITPPSDAFQSALLQKSVAALAAETGWPTFENIEKSSPEECRAKLESIVAVLPQLQPDRWQSSREPSKSAVAVATTAICTLCYPQARNWMLAQGRTVEEIDKLSVYQVVARYVFLEIDASYDRLLVTATFPAGSSHTAIPSEEQLLEKYRSPVDWYSMYMLPVARAAQAGCVYQHQMYELLKIIEAIRYYAAVHDGRLPDSLEAIKEVPVATVDPMTGKPFGFRVDGRTAIIDFKLVGKRRLEITVQDATAKGK